MSLPRTFVLLNLALGQLAGARSGLATPADSRVEDASQVLSQSLFSESLSGRLDYMISLPPDYARNLDDRFAVVYLLHGRGDTMRAWTDAAEDLHRLAAEGRIPPVIAVMPDVPASRRASYYVDSRFSGDAQIPAGQPVETALTVELLAHIDGAFRTRRDRSGRIVAGYSMGGFGALRFALARQELFGGAIVLSPAVYSPLPPPDSSTRAFGAFGLEREPFSAEVYRSLNYPALLPAVEARGLTLSVFIAAGDDESEQADSAGAIHDLDMEAHVLYSQLRRNKAIRAELRIVNGGHDWSVWRPMFVEGIEWVFRTTNSAGGIAQPNH